MSISAVLDRLSNLLSARQVSRAPGELSVYDCDGFTIARAAPAAVVFPENSRQVAEVVRILSEGGIQIVPRGSGTGLTGGCVAFENGVVVSTARMTRIMCIDLANRVAHVEAGVRNTQLSEAVAALPGGERLHFAPDPSSQKASTIGGNAATNAGGIHTLKDFVSSNHVFGMEMVLADGTIVSVGGANGCTEGGPFDLAGLICGSEGTLGILTSLWVRLAPKPSHYRTAVTTFDSTSNACRAVSETIAAGFLPSAMEMLDGKMVQVVEEAFHLGFEARTQALILTEVDGVDGLLDQQMDAILDIHRRNGTTHVEMSADPQARAKLWKARKGAFAALGRISPSYCTQDACVPRSRLADVLQRIAEIGLEHGLTIPSAFHAGDGNIHPVFLYDDKDEAQTQNVLLAAEKVLRYCIDIGGTVTGEHGVGVEKLHLMAYQFDRATMETFAAVKGAFDPGQAINAGKLIPSDRVRVQLIKPGRHVPQ